MTLEIRLITNEGKCEKDWKIKVKSDVREIISMNHDEDQGYARISLMFNQLISDKKNRSKEGN